MSWNLSLQLNNLYAAVKALQATAISNPVAATFRINALTANTTYGIIDCGSISANRTSGQLILTNYAGTPTLTLNANNTSAFAADITVNGITVGRGNTYVSSNTAVGLNALVSTGGSTQHLTAVGIGALQSASTTNFTTGLGSGAFSNLTAGSTNIGIGYNAGANLVDGSLNTYIGSTTAGSTSAQYETVIANGLLSVGGNTGKGNNTTLITGSTAYLPATIVQNTGSSITLGNSTTTGGVSIPYGNLTFGSTGAVIANQLITATYTNSVSASVVLTSTSPQYQLNTYGGGVCTYTLPDATTLTKGTVFQINNNSSGGNSVTISTYGGATLVSGLLVGSITEIVNLTNATSVGTWDTHGSAPSNANWGTSGLSYAGNITLTGTKDVSVSSTGKVNTNTVASLTTTALTLNSNNTGSLGEIVLQKGGVTYGTIQNANSSYNLQLVSESGMSLDSKANGTINIAANGSGNVNLIAQSGVVRASFNGTATTIGTTGTAQGMYFLNAPGNAINFFTTGYPIFAIGTYNTTISHALGAGVGIDFQTYYYNGVAIGSIYQDTAASVRLNTSSDYRLKDNIQPINDCLTILNKLKPISFNWKDGGEHTLGFLAHEFAEVFPNKVTGEKDAVDAEGRIKSQFMSDACCIPLLVSCVQEQQTKITSLEAQLASLKATVDALVAQKDILVV